MSRDLGIPGAAASPPTPGPPGPSPHPAPANGRAPAPPPAARATSPGWRDPRLWLGVAIVAVSVVAGSRVLATADDTVAVWSVVSDLGPGDTVTESDLEARRVRFADSADLDRYVTVDDTLPADLELTRGVGAGELLPRAALGSAGDSGTMLVRIAVEDEQIPGAVGEGSSVNVFLVGSRPGGAAAKAPGEPTLEGVTVVEAPPVADNLAATGNRTIDVAVTEQQARAYFEDRAALESPTVTVVEVG